MDPISLLSGYAQVNGVAGQGYASTLFGHTLGYFRGNGAYCSTLLTRSDVGMNFLAGGQNYMLRPDTCSRLAYGSSYSVFNNGQYCGWIASNPVTSQLASGGGLSDNLGSGLGASLASSGNF